MNRWDHIDRLFAEALEQPPDKRDAFLDAACRLDETLREEVEKLLESHEKADSFLEEPAEVSASNLWRGFSEEILTGEEPAGRSGQRLGAWRLVKEIGQGGMGVVYLAERADGQFEQRAAVKLLRFGLSGEEHVHRFLNERQVLASLEHPHIARLYDGGITEEGTPWFAMEYVEGLPITRHCEENGLSPDERLTLFEKVCRAVEHAHHHLIIHRDLKPSNIFVTEDGSPRILDFGLAKALEDPLGDASTTQPSRRWMTLDYASPEQVRGAPVGTPSDTYQLGLVLYEILTGRKAYTVEGLSPTEAQRIICDVDPPKPSTAAIENGAEGDGRRRFLQRDRVRQRLEGDVDTIVMKALHKEPDHGYASAEAMANDLERYRTGLPILARPDTLGYRAKKFVQRHRWPVLAGVLVFLSLLAGMAGTLWQAQRATANERRALNQREKAEEVTTFLTDLFKASDPTVAQGDTITARELLDDGERYAEGLNDQPELQATLLGTLGTVHQNLGNYEHAVTLYRRALGAWESLNGDGPPDDAYVKTRFRLGQTLISLGRFRNAETQLQWVIDQRNPLGMEDPLRRDALFHLFEALHNLDRTEAANEVFAAWQEANEHVPAASDADAAERMISTAEVLGNRGQIRGNVETIRRALALNANGLEIIRTTLGEHHPLVALALNKRSQLLIQERGLVDASPEMLARADSVSREALALHQRLYDEPNTELAVALSHRSGLLRRLERYDEAERLIHQAMAINKRLEGQDTGMWIGDLFDLALINRDQGKYEDAINQFARVRDWWANKYGKDYLFALTKSLTLGSALAMAERFEEAERELLAAYETLERDRGQDDRFTQDALRQIVELYEAWGKPEEAERFRERRIEAEH